MKRTPLVRKTRLARGTKPLPPVNERQQANRRKRLAKLRRSPEHREALRVAKERSGNRCEFVYEGAVRCHETEHLEGHHVRYDPPVFLILCRRHHELVESEIRPWNKNRLGAPR